MAKTYNKDKHFDANYFRTKGLAFFDTLDFSDISSEEIKAIINYGFPEVEFYQCIFKDLDLSGTEFHPKLSFTQCEFSGNTNFEKCVFHKDTSFTHSVFNGITNFDSIIYEKDLIFSYIRTKPAKDGYFYFRGDADNNRHKQSYVDHLLNFTGAIFETEVSFLNNQFFGDTIFQNAVFRNKFWFTNVDFGFKTNIDVKFDCDGFKNIDMCYRILRDALMLKGYKFQSQAIERLEEKIYKKQGKESNLPDNNPEIKYNSNLMTTEDAAKYLKLKPNTLERWRTQYPDRLPFVKIGRTVKYRLEDLQAYVSDNRKS
ncbi:MAG: pentapeptide repeat-containing protein [Alphaproteobacteria bacterium]|nr:pentapeptide repeat-containing protein [Alphaproteobacteria bacterium]